MSYTTLNDLRCDIIVLNVHAPTEDKDDVIKESFYEELEQVLHQFLRHNMKILLGDFNGKEGREDIFKTIIDNKRLHEANNDNLVTVVNFATSKILIDKIQYSHTATFINTLDFSLFLTSYVPHNVLFHELELKYLNSVVK
jgi:hypothetical protein